jgi:hypothetical protein
VDVAVLLDNDLSGVVALAGFALPDDDRSQNSLPLVRRPSYYSDGNGRKQPEMSGKETPLNGSQVPDTSKGVSKIRAYRLTGMAYHE